MTSRAIVAAILCALAGIAAAETLAGRIVAVSDGDTLTLLDGDNRQHRIRLDGIDAPESGQAFGTRSKQSLAELAHGREAVAECHKSDCYGRPVCKVLIDGADVGLEQLPRGLAWHFKRYEREQSATDRAAYAAAEDEARQVAGAALAVAHRSALTSVKLCRAVLRRFPTY